MVEPLGDQHSTGIAEQGYDYTNGIVWGADRKTPRNLNNDGVRDYLVVVGA